MLTEMMLMIVWTPADNVFSLDGVRVCAWNHSILTALVLFFLFC